MYQSEIDKKLDALRDQARYELIEQYEIQAAQAALEFGFLNIHGHEVPDPTIVDPPLGYIKQPDLMELMRRMIRSELSETIDNAQVETFEEADDFDIDDDPVDYTSPYEEFFDPAPGAPKGPPGEVHPDRQDPNASEVVPAPPGEKATPVPPGENNAPPAS